MDKFNWSIRVYYEDTDAAGIVYYANYLKFMERARTEWLRALGFEQTQLRQKYGIIFVARQITVDYLKPAFFNDLLQVNAHLDKLGKASMTLSQKVQRQEQVLCVATGRFACINGVTLQPCSFPPEVFKVLQS